MNNNEDYFIVFYNTLKHGIWPEIKINKKIPKGWYYGYFEGVLPNVLNNKYDTEAWYYGPNKTQQKMREYLKYEYNHYKKLGFISEFTIRKKYPKK